MGVASGEFVILCGDSRELMQSVHDGEVDAVVTDPPYQGFDFHPKTYFETLDSFLAEMLRCVGSPPRIAISQPEFRLQQIHKRLGTGSVIKISDAFDDHRGDDALFFATNLLSPASVQVKNWSELPRTTHPNPRDINKMAALIQVMTEPGDLVLDPFCGSGAIGLAAVLLGRNYIGIELERSRAEDARRRFNELGVSEFDWRRGRDSNPR
ncbi:MAG: site-specific DNA-methyltransferase [Pseudomonadales bacterium]|nr:site-specific DNA-methyltransferase [Pseudomonadales bacterium]